VGLTFLTGPAPANKQVVREGYIVWFDSVLHYLHACGDRQTKEEKTEDRLKIQELLKHAENFYLS
jgi:hypothetical protein